MSAGLWAKAQVDAEFDEAKSKARYIRLRVESLKVAATQVKAADADFYNACKFQALKDFDAAIHGNFLYPRGFLHLAKNGHALAQVKLGNILEFGPGLPTDMESAILYYQRAAAQGNAWGMYNMARVTYVTGDYNEAASWYERAKRSCADADDSLRQALSAEVPWIAHLQRSLPSP
jgi:TPR repeat protein